MPGESNLPYWFQKPTQHTVDQLDLFPEPLGSVLARFSVSSDEAMRWHKQGWISFEPNPKKKLEVAELFEIEFVRDLTRSGLPDAMIGHLLTLLPAPLSYNPRSIAYSFSMGWVEPGPQPDFNETTVIETIDKHLRSWLAELAKKGETERLESLVEEIVDLIVESKHG